MRKATIPAALALGLLIGAAPARAEGDANTFLKLIDEGDGRLNILLYGYATGFAWSNARMEQTGQRPLFCEPKDNQAITPERNLQILRDYLKSSPSSASSMPAWSCSRPTRRSGPASKAGAAHRA